MSVVQHKTLNNYSLVQEYIDLREAYRLRDEKKHIDRARSELVETLLSRVQVARLYFQQGSRQNMADRK
jgi:hypothetical protein